MLSSFKYGEGKGNPLQYSCLENPMDGGAWWAAVHGVATEQLHFHFLLLCIGEGNGNPLLCSCLENPRDSGAWWAAVYGVAQSRTRLKRLSSSSSSPPNKDSVPSTVSDNLPDSASFQKPSLGCSVSLSSAYKLLSTFNINSGAESQCFGKSREQAWVCCVST